MNILVTGAWREAKEHLEDLRQMGHEVMFLKQEAAALPCDVEWVEGIIANDIFRTHHIEKFKNLKYIQLTSAGFDRVPMDYIRKNEIAIHHAAGVYSIPMAEFVIFRVLDIYKSPEFFRKNQREHCWEKNRCIRELFGKKVLIIGCGNVGKECAKRFKAFGCEVMGLTRSDSLTGEKPLGCIEHFDKLYSVSHLNEQLSNADIILLAVPLTDETRHLLNAESFKRIKEDAVLINVSRGTVIDEKALCDAAENIGAAVLDVFAEEPLAPESPLWDKENVYITPHNSFVGEGNGERLKELVFGNLGKYSG